jgi:hypothetical protein
MSLDEFMDFMNDTITIQPFLGRDGYGTAMFGVPILYNCRVSGQQKQVVDAMGVERVSKATIYVMGQPPIGPTDRLTMPSGFDPQEPPILAINALSDESGAHHLEIDV